MTKKINVKKDSKDKRKAYESILLLLLTIALFVSATYAWFTDSAYSRGNKLFAGNLYIDIVASEDDLIAAGHEADLASYGTPYTRKLVGGDEQGTNYYYITDKEANVVNIYNLEPGQYRKVSIDYLNTGDLAFKTVGALQVETNLNSFETLNAQFENELQVYKNKYQVTTEAVQGNKDILAKFEDADYLFHDSITESQLIDNGDNVITIDGVECIVLQYVKYDSDNDIFNNVSKEEATHALMMTKDPLATDVSFALTNTDTPYSDSNVKDFLNNAYADPFNNDPSIISVNHTYYYGDSSHEIDYFEGEDINKPILKPNALTPTTLSEQHLFLPDTEALLKNLFRFDIGNYFYLNCSYHDSKAAVGNDYRALLLQGNETSPTLMFNNIEAPGKVRACFYYDLNEIPYSAPTIDQKTIFESDDEYYEFDDDFTYDEYIYRFNKLRERIHGDIIPSILKGHDDEYYKISRYVPDESSPGSYILEETTPGGLGWLPKDYGRLSNVLEVYVTTDTSEIEKGHDSAYYFGNVDNFSYLVQNGPTAINNIAELTDEQFTYILENYRDKNVLPGEYNTPDYMYKVLLNDKEASLYDDYQRYLACGSGYCLPIEAVTNSEKKVDPNTQVKIYSNNVYEGDYETVQASEMGTLEFLLYLPKEAGDEYQNCTLSLSLGGTATQVEYEVDDLGIMIYDKTKAKVKSNFKVGDIISISPDEDMEHAGYLRVLNKSGSNYDVAVIGGNIGAIPFFPHAIDDIDDNDLIYPLEGSDRIPNKAYLSLYKGSALHMMNSMFAAEMTYEFDEYAVNFLFGDQIEDGLVDVDGKKYTIDEFIKLISERAKDSEDYEILKGLVKKEYTQDVYELVYIKAVNDGKVLEIDCDIDPDYIIKDDETNPRYTYGVKKVDSIVLDSVPCYIRSLTIEDISNALGKTSITYDEIDKLFYGYAYDENDDYNPYDMWLSDAIYINKEVQDTIDSIELFDADYPLALYLSYGDGIRFDYSLTEDKKVKTTGDFDAPYIRKEPSMVFTINLDETNYYINKVASWPEDFDGLSDGQKEEKDAKINVQFLLESSSSVYQQYFNDIEPSKYSKYNYQVSVPNNDQNILDLIDHYKDSPCDCYVIELPNDLELIKKVFEIVPNLERDVYFVGASPIEMNIQPKGDNKIEMLGATPDDYAQFFDMNKSSLNFNNEKVMCSYIADEQNQNYDSKFSTTVSAGLNNKNITGLFDLNTERFSVINTTQDDNLASVFKEALSKGEQIGTIVLPYISSQNGDSLNKLLTHIGSNDFSLTKDSKKEDIKLDIIVYYMNRELPDDIRNIVDNFEDSYSQSNDKLNSITVVYRDDEAIAKNVLNHLTIDYFDSSSAEDGSAIAIPATENRPIITSYSNYSVEVAE